MSRDGLLQWHYRPQCFAWVWQERPQCHLWAEHNANEWKHHSHGFLIISCVLFFNKPLKYKALCEKLLKLTAMRSVASSQAKKQHKTTFQVVFVIILKSMLHKTYLMNVYVHTYLIDSWIWSVYSRNPLLAEFSELCSRCSAIILLSFQTRLTPQPRNQRQGENNETIVCLNHQQIECTI